MVEKFGERLESLMNIKGVNKKQICEATGIALFTLNRYLAGVTFPRLDIACDIAELLGVSLNELCGIPATIGNDSDYKMLIDTIRINANRLNEKQKATLVNAFFESEE